LSVQVNRLQEDKVGLGEQISQLATKLQEQSIGGNQNDSSDAEFEKLKDELEKTKKAMEQVSEKL